MNSNYYFLNDTFENLSLSHLDKIVNAEDNLQQKNKNDNCIAPNVKEIVTRKTAVNIEDLVSFDDSLYLSHSSNISSKEDIFASIPSSEVSAPNLNTRQINNVDRDKSMPDTISMYSSKVNTNFEYTTNAIEESKLSSKLDVQNNLVKTQTITEELAKSNCIHDLVKINSSNMTVDVKNICKNDSNNLDNLKLSSWGLPQAVLEKYQSRKIKDMFTWQFECLNNKELLNGLSNLVYSAPTSAGKTLVAEILAIKNIFERNKKVIFILPFVSIVREKMYYFQDILGSSGVRVEGFMGSYNPPGGFQTVQFAICTIEKANSLINRLLEESKLEEVGAVLVDEMHLIGDPHRGYILELLLTKLKYISRKHENIKIQIIGMSATLPNLKDIANWLNAQLYTTSYRPIPLHEQTHISGEIYDRNMHLIRKLQPLPELVTDTDNILQLCLETIKDKSSVLIFCPTKNWCENLAHQISAAFCKLGKTDYTLGKLLRSQLNTDLITELLQQLKYCPVGLDDVLRKTVSFGVAFHHAGLTIDERDIVEGAFRNGAVRVLVATSTLSSGVNLPARRVIIRTTSFHGKCIDTLTYRQMIGRAGRLGKDSIGESFIICQKNDYHIAKNLMSAELPPVDSCLEGAGKLQRAILEVIASGVASTPEDLKLYTDCTFIAAKLGNQSTSQDADLDLENPIQEALTFLINNEFIRLQNGEGQSIKYVPTGLAKACFSSSITPEEGLALFTELEKARQCLVLENELHLVYLITPYSACNSWGNIDWMVYLDIWEKLPACMKRVGSLVGIRDSYIVNATRGKILTNTNKLYQKFLVHQRFFVALALYDLVNEVPLNKVCAKFSCNRGMLQSLQQSASSFAGMVTSFSKQLGWACIEILVSQFQERMQFGISRDLLDLMHLPSLNCKMARALYNSGIDSLINLANSDADIVENILHKVLPFETLRERDGESELEKNQRNKLRRIWVTGKDGLTEREVSKMLVKDAREYLKIKMGLVDAKWEASQSDLKEIVTGHSIKPCALDVMQKKKSNKHHLVSNTSQTEVLPTVQNIPSPCYAFSKVTKNKNQNKLLEEGSKNKTLPRKTEIEDISRNRTIEKSKVSKILISHSPADLNISSTPTVLSGENTTEISDQYKRNFQECFTLQGTSQSSESLNRTFDNNVCGDPMLNGSIKFDKAFNSSSDVINFNSSSEDLFGSSSITTMQRKRIRENSVDISSKETTPLKRKRMSNVSLNEIKNAKDYDKDYPDTYINNKNQFYNISDFSKLQIVYVCSSNLLLETFANELNRKKEISFSLGCSNILQNQPLIGLNILNTTQVNHSSKQEGQINFTCGNRKVDGFSLSWDGQTAYYISLKNSEYCKKIFQLLKTIFKSTKNVVKMFNSKDHIKVLKQCCGLELNCSIEDPKIADWMLNPDEKEKNLYAMAVAYCPEATCLTQLAGSYKGVGSIALDLNSCTESTIRSSVESIVTWHLTSILKQRLREHCSSYTDIYETEMKTILCISKMEISGMGVSKDELQKLADLLQSQIDSIEKKAYSLAGRRFNFLVSSDVAKLIGQYKGKKVSMKKTILEHNNHPISNLVIQWRKSNFTMKKIIYPLLRCIENGRINPCHIVHTATGRISMHEPNLQNIPKDYHVINPITNESIKISCRNAFCAPQNHCLISADYCQLELRILAHLSQDSILCSIMKQPGDVFLSIAAKWNKVSEEKVSDIMRQNTKHLCYGIIYGMGSKTISEQLSISEEKAILFVETFKNTYPGVKTYIQETIDKCRKLGYVETIMGRRRSFPHINETTAMLKGQAERQAVNTTVQGSASDIVKQAMVFIEDKLQEIFGKAKNKPKLTLHLHDELIYEVPLKYMRKVAKIIKQCMENAVELSVPFPVKLKTGPSWGQLREYNL